MVKYDDGCRKGAKSIYTQRQKLRTTNLLVKGFRKWLHDANKPYK